MATSKTQLQLDILSGKTPANTPKIRRQVKKRTVAKGKKVMKNLKKF